MQRDPPETTELQAFVHIVEAGSVAAAAAELDVPRATVSRRLARLEDRLSVRLLRRTTRRIGLTDAGEELYPHARSIVHAVEAASEAVRRDDDVPRGLLRVSVPPSTDGRFSSLFLAFLATYPEVQLEVLASSRLEDLVVSGIDVALRAGTTLDPGLIARQLHASDAVAVASPAYLERAGTPATPADLAHHACLVGYARGERPATHWPLWSGGRVRVDGRLVSNDLSLLHAAALAGVGIALLPQMLAGEHVDRGRLVVVLDGVVGGRTQLALVYPERQHLKPAVRAFIDFATARLGDLLAPARNDAAGGDRARREV
ncbi:MAG: LysR family transcriptional regulator [Myxococcota bacterium]